MVPPSSPAIESLKAQFHITGPLLLYVGNLESYQGIDLLLESFAQVHPKASEAHLIAIGGNPDDVAQYQAQTEQLGIASRAHFVGPRPIAHLKHYLEQADIVVSPRIHGNNTPMKLYSYLDSGKALLATDLPTHTQVLNSEMAYLSPASPTEFANGMLHLIEHPALRATLGKAAQAYIAREHTYEAFSNKLSGLYDWLQQELVPSQI